MEEAVKESAILKEKDVEFLWDRKDTVPVVTGKGNIFKVTTMREAKESATIRRIMARDHIVYIIFNIFVRMEQILDVFKVVEKIVFRKFFLNIRVFYNKVIKKRKSPYPLS